MKDRESAERDDKSSDKFATVETRGERHSNDEKVNKCSPTTEERGNRRETLSRPRKIRTVQVTDLIACKLLKDR